MNEIKCNKCHKDISTDYCKLNYKIVDQKGKIRTFKGTLCRKCLAKHEDKIGKAEKIIHLFETVSLHVKHPKKIYHKKKQTKS